MTWDLDITVTWHHHIFHQTTHFFPFRSHFPVYLGDGTLLATGKVGRGSRGAGFGALKGTGFAGSPSCEKTKANGPMGSDEIEGIQNNQL